MNISIYIKNNKLTLYDNESIVLKSSFADITDLTKLKADFTRSFTVPANDVNNRIFKHYYNANIDNTFDARKKIDGRIEIEGLPFKIGKFSLIDVSVKNGLPSSYNINFTGNLLDLESKLGKSKLSELDLSEFDFEFTGENIKTSLTSSLSNGVLKTVPLVSKQLYYNSNVSDTTNTDEITNIASNGNTDVRGVNYNDLKPSIKLISLIDKIESQYGINFSRDFIGGANFSDLYLLCRNNNDLKDVKQLIDFNSGDTRFCDLTTNIFTIYNNSAFTDSIFNINVNVNPLSGYEDNTFKVVFEVDGEEVKRSIDRKGLSNESYKLGRIDNPTEVKFYIEAKEGFEANVTVDLSELDPTNLFTNEYTTNGEVDFVYNFIVSDNLPDIEIIDFLKELFKVFKLIAIPLDDGTIYLETLNNYYSLGSYIDLTKYIDLNEYTVGRGNLINKIDYKFSEPKTILNNEFNNSNNKYYGDKELILTDEDGSVLDGDSELIESKFEQVLYERLTNQEDGSLTNIGYGALIDEDRNKKTPSLLLHYVVNKDISFSSVNFISDNNNVEVLNSLNIPSHSVNLDDEDLQPFSFLFGEEFSYYTYNKLVNNLYNSYHSKYINGLFNVKRRDFKYQAVLSQNILYKLKLNDIVVIDNNYYRIDFFECDITTGKTDLKLFNAYDSLVSSSGSSFNITYDNQSVFFPYSISSSQNVDLGSGTDWYSYSIVGNNIVFSLSLNNTAGVRYGKINITDSLGNIYIFFINQNNAPITIDSLNIKVDNNITTIDNA